MINLSFLFSAWLIAKRRLKENKKDEAALRVMLIDRLWNVLPEPGRYHALGGEVVGTFKLNYTLEKDHNILTAQLEEMSRLFPDLQIGNLIEWVPKLNVKAYEALPFEARQIFSSVLTIKRALPTLALVSEQDTDE
jgi:hypothetical protein